MASAFQFLHRLHRLVKQERKWSMVSALRRRRHRPVKQEPELVNGVCVTPPPPDLPPALVKQERNVVNGVCVTPPPPPPPTCDSRSSELPSMVNCVTTAATAATDL